MTFMFDICTFIALIVDSSERTPIFAKFKVIFFGFIIVWIKAQVVHVPIFIRPEIIIQTAVISLPKNLCCCNFSRKQFNAMPRGVSVALKGFQDDFDLELKLLLELFKKGT